MISVAWQRARILGTENLQMSPTNLSLLLIPCRALQRHDMGFQPAVDQEELEGLSGYVVCTVRDIL